MDTALQYQLAIAAQLPEGDHSTAIHVERYYVELGTAVRRGDAVALLRSSRYVYDLPAEGDGVVVEMFAAHGASVEPGTALLVLGEPEQAEASSPTVATQNGRRRRITPLARRIAALHALDLSRVAENWGNGRIRGADVRALLTHSPPVMGPPPVAVESTEQQSRSSPSTTVLAERLPLMRLAAPVAITAIEVDLERAHEVCESSVRGRGNVVIDYLHCVAYAAAQAMVEHRYLNSRWSDEGIVLYGRVDLRIETAGGRSLVLRDAADLGLKGMARLVREAMARSHSADLPANGREPALAIAVSPPSGPWWSAPAEVSAGAALLTLASVQRRPVVVEEPAGPRIAIRERALLTLAYDARYISPLVADSFLLDVRRRLEALR